VRLFVQDLVSQHPELFPKAMAIVLYKSVPIRFLIAKRGK
jgi:hypothetical protein